MIVQTPNRQKILVQACESMTHEQTRKREILALMDAMTELGLNVGTIVTRYEEEQLHIDGKIIHIIPVWRFLLEQSMEYFLSNKINFVLYPCRQARQRDKLEKLAYEAWKCVIFNSRVVRVIHLHFGFLLNQ